MGIFDKILEILGKSSIKQEATLAMPEVDKALLIDKIRQSETFKNLPAENLEKMFSVMETVKVRAGDAIVREGEEGDYYYLLVNGTARVSRRQQKDGKSQVVAELTEPTAFGEEALISNAKRNATVTMTSDGTVMRLSKDAFNEHIREPMLIWLSPMDAHEQVAKGAKWIDVRDAEQARQTCLHGAISIPMEELRDRASELDKQTLYICYCENGRLSATAAFLLRQRGYNVGVLRGGLQGLKRTGVG